MKYIIYSLFILLSCCNYNQSDRRIKFEKYLSSFVGQPESAVIYEFGKPDLYDNIPDVTNAIPGTMMIYKLEYDFSASKYNCLIKFKIGEKSSKIIEWDYNGTGCY